MHVCCFVGNFRAGVFIQLQPFRHAGNKCVDEEKGELRGKREEREKREGRKRKRERRERGKGRKKISFIA